MKFQDAVNYIYDIPKFTTKNSLAHTKRLLGCLGHPEESFHIVHVAGSNGKGSVCAYVNQIFLEAGLHVGLFTSPHLVSMTERMVIDGVPILEAAFLEDFSEVKAMVEKQVSEGLAHPTFFEFLFLMAMVRFRKAAVDWVILETGLGGRLDATSACDHPTVTAITSISLEHTEYLGNTIEEIAGEKAGIIRPNVPVIYDNTVHAAGKVIARVAEENKALAIPVDASMYEIFPNTGQGIDFSFLCQYDKQRLHLETAALYQVQNAAIAIRIAQKCLPDTPARKAQIAAGLLHAKWPGRMEEALPGIYLDGAHNPSGIQAFLTSVDHLEKTSAKPPILLVAALRDKNYRAMLETLFADSRWQEVVVTQVSDGRALAAETLAAEIAQCSVVPLRVILDVAEAFSYAKSKKIQAQHLFCTGSLYLIGALETCIAEEKTC